MVERMRIARLHGIRDLRVEEIDIPTPGPGELLVKVEACGVCATDSRKYLIGVNDGQYPFNPGHEWVSWVAQTGAGVTNWCVGDRLYGDTYGGYAEYAIITVEPCNWSCGPLPIPEDAPIERAISVEPMADCFHGVRDQASVQPGDQLVVIASGAMGLKTVAVAARFGVRVLVVEPIVERRNLALRFGAEEAVSSTDWIEKVRDWTRGKGANAVILTIGAANLVGDCVGVCGVGGRVVLFAGFGNNYKAELDCNDLHYREISLIGSEWVGTPPHQHCERYDAALELLLDRSLSFDELVTGVCSFTDLETAFIQRDSYAGIKSMFVTEDSK